MQNRIITQIKGRRLFPILLLFICIMEERFYIHNFTSSFLLPKDAIIIISFISKIFTGALLNGLNLSPDDSHVKTNTCSSIFSIFFLLMTLSFGCFLTNLINYFTKFSYPGLISFLGISQGFIVVFQDIQVTYYPMDIIERNTKTKGANYLIASQFIFILSFLFSLVYKIYFQQSFSIISIFTTIICLVFYIGKVFIIFFSQYKEKKLMKESNISPYVILLFKGFFGLLFFFSYMEMDSKALKAILVNPRALSHMFYFLVLKILVEAGKVYATYWFCAYRAWVEFLSIFAVMFINFPSFGGVWLFITTIVCFLLSFYGNCCFYKKKTIHDININKFSEL